MTERKPSSTRLSTFGLPGQGIETRFFRTAEDALHEVRRAHRLGFPVLPSGHGTNCAFLEPTIPAVFLKSIDRTIRVNVKKSSVIVIVGAGLAWDDLVRFAVKKSWSGIERLSGIPGTVGAAPVQNIGAYGASLADVLVSVDCLNLVTLERMTLNSADCHFGYRTSIFNTSHRGEFLILSIVLRLNVQKNASVGDHKELAKSLPDHPTLLQVRPAILAIRKRKLPDWRTDPNCGSFFKNPIVTKKIATAFLNKHPDAPHWSEAHGRIKFSAGWLIEQSGVRKKHWGKIAISPQHALVLVNCGEKNHERLRDAIRVITRTIKKKFGFVLLPEPNLIDRDYASGIFKTQFKK